MSNHSSGVDSDPQPMNEQPVPRSAEEQSPCEGCGVSAADINGLTDQIDSLQALLREARWYVFHADCPHESAYDDQQAMLKKIDEAAPAPPPPARPEICDKELAPGIRCGS